MEDGIEKMLVEKGFTPKEIGDIKFWSERDGVSVDETVRRIRRVFIGSMMLLLFMLLLSISEYFRVGGVGFYAVLGACLIGAIAVFTFAPLLLGAKVTFRIKK
ncbi:hypothetical protein VRB95_15555 [Erwinia aphidicola]|uniref:hypothetical protein n=1 Tax=Erwinia aphidicola TaxID=68334 RepID=UPI0030CDB227